MTKEQITAHLERSIAEQGFRIEEAERRVAAALERGDCTPAQAERSRRVSIGRMRARLAYLENELLAYLGEGT